MNKSQQKINAIKLAKVLRQYLDNKSQPTTNPNRKKTDGTSK
jgi:hypothetical protein